MSAESATTREYASLTKPKISVVNHVWTIENFRLCYFMDGDELMSSVFSFGENDWRMQLYRDCCTIFHFCLVPVDQTTAIEKLRGNYKLSIRKENEDISWSDFINSTNTRNICDFYLDSKEFYDNLSDGCLTLFFEFTTLKSMVTTQGDLYTPSTLKKMHEESMKSLVGNVSHSDVVLVSAEKEELHAYKGILAAHSRVFGAMFQVNMRERNEGRVTIDDISSSVLKKMLAFMYTGEVPDLSNADDAIGLLEAAAKYEIDVLKEYCADSMPGPTVGNVCEMLALAHLHDVQKLKARAATFIKQHGDAVVKTEGWRELYKKPELVQFVISHQMAGK